MREVAKQALIGQSPDKPVTTVSRPNWLKVIVGRLNERFVVVLVSDVSETVRFSQIRDSFITNVSEQLLKPTQSLEELADALEHDSDNKAAIEGNTVKLRQSCARMEHMVSDLLLLIKAQEPILPTASNRINVMEQVKTVVDAHRDMAQRRGIDIEIDGDESLDINGEGEQIQAAVAKLLRMASVSRSGISNSSLNCSIFSLMSFSAISFFRSSSLLADAFTVRPENSPTTRTRHSASESRRFFIVSSSVFR